MSSLPERPTTPVSMVIGMWIVGLIVGLVVLWWLIGVLTALLKTVVLVTLVGGAIYAVTKLGRTPNP